MNVLRMRLGVDLVLSVAAGWSLESVALGCALVSYAVTLFAFNVRVNKALLVSEDYRKALSRMEHSQGEALKESTGLAAEAHDRWSRMMDQAEKQMAEPDNDLFGELGIDPDEEDDDE
tara:strand:- start:1845 stop:2198 length:354 start_codon:yes stop_codon:yes gene_type:complete